MRTVYQIQEELDQWNPHELQETDQWYNDLNRELIQAYASEHDNKDVWIGKLTGRFMINTVPSHIRVYDPEKPIYNFDIDFIIHSPSQLLFKGFEAMDKNGIDSIRLGSITGLIEKEGGIILVWV